jgi:hypothetical protein
MWGVRRRGEGEVWGSPRGGVPGGRGPGGGRYQYPGDYRGWARCFEGDMTGVYPAGVIGGEAELGDWEAGETGLGGVPPR